MGGRTSTLTRRNSSVGRSGCFWIKAHHGGKGAGRSPSMRRRIFRNSSLGTATSASWKVTYRPWLTTLAPILTSFSRSVVNDQCSTSFGTANFSFASTAVLRRDRLEGLLPGVKQTKSGAQRTLRLDVGKYSQVRDDEARTDGPGAHGGCQPCRNCHKEARGRHESGSALIGSARDSFRSRQRTQGSAPARARRTAGGPRSRPDTAERMCAHALGGKRDRAPRPLARKPAWRLNAGRAESSARRYKSDSNRPGTALTLRPGVHLGNVR